MKQLWLITSLIIITQCADVDRLFDMNAMSIPESDRHTINLLVWQDNRQPEYKLPAIQLALERVKNESILPDEEMINIHLIYGCMSSGFGGVVDFYRDKRWFEIEYPNNTRIHGVIGPRSTSCLENAAEVIGRYENIPVIPYSAVGPQMLDDRDRRFPTLSRIAFTSTQMAAGILKLVREFGWTQIAIVATTTNSGSATGFSATATQEHLIENGIKVNFLDAMNQYSSNETVDEILNNITAKARIIFVPSTNPCKYGEIRFLARAHEREMLNGNFVFIIGHTDGIVVESTAATWCVEGAYENYTYLYDRPGVFKISFKGMNKENYLDGSAQLKRFGKTYFSDIMRDINIVDATYSMLYAMGQVLEVDGWDQINNGKKIKQKLVNQTITVPLDEPVCLFDGSACDYTTEIVSAIGVVLLIVLLVIAYKLQQRRKLAKLMSMTWRVDLDNLRIILGDQSSHSTVGKTNKSMMSVFSVKDIKETIVKYEDTLKNFDTIEENPDDMPSVETKVGILADIRCKANHYNQSRAVESFPVESLRIIEELRNVKTDTLNTFIGISFNQFNKFTIIWKYEARCTLYDVIGNTDFSLSQDFQNSFLNDIVKGLEYLHVTAKVCHGQLNLLTCVVTPQWTIRISQYGLNKVLSKAFGNGLVQIPNPTLHEWLHIAPEHMKMTDSSMPGDMYSLGVVAYEVSNRSFIQEGHENLEQPKMAEGQMKNIRRTSRPAIKWITGSAKSNVAKIMKACTNVNLATRPTIEGVNKLMAKEIKGKLGSGGIVDHMMKMMETYAKDLERLVGERTASLEETQRQADRLLHQLLPRSVAEALKAGRTIEPELYASATIGFVDIVQFTNFCAHSTPFHIVALLNELFSQFDAIVATYEAYKVETIGDAYMIVSGIPIRNGNRHAHDICGTLCGMLIAARRHKVAHMPSDYQVTLRGGVHTGPTAAGVVGIHAPRYCLFGDTVNTASRMESNGVPNRVQISEATVACLDMHGRREFDVTIRGEIEVKGKGMMKTHFVTKK